MRKKVTIVGGGGAVGATAAQRIIDRGLADVVLADVLEGIPAGRALDMLESTPIIRSDVNAIGFTSKDSDYRETAQSDIIVVTAGFPRKPGMSRSDLLQGNYDIVKAVVGPVVKHSPDAILIIVTNPLDAMAYAGYKLSGFPKQRVIGMAGVLDSGRMSTFVAQELGVSVASVHSLVLGGHGDTMVPLPRYTTVASIPLPELLSKERIEAINQRTRDGGAEIVGLLKTGSAFYAPAESAIVMAKSYLRDKKRVLPCAANLKGEYGLNDMYVGVPCIIGKDGVEKVIEIELSANERAMFDHSVNAVKGLVDASKGIDPSVG
jgi:malate dehydrogenase